VFLKFLMPSRSSCNFMFDAFRGQIRTNFRLPSSFTPEMQPRRLHVPPHSWSRGHLRGLTAQDFQITIPSPKSLILTSLFSHVHISLSCSRSSLAIYIHSHISTYTICLLNNSGSITWLLSDSQSGPFSCVMPRPLLLLPPVEFPITVII